MLAISDLHISANKRDHYRLDFLEALIGILERRQPDCLLILGDLTEEKDRHPARVVNAVVALIHAYSLICPVVILQGNHDYRSEGHPFFAFTQCLKDVYWINTPTIGSDLQREVGYIFKNDLFLPHTFDHERDWAAHKADIQAGRFSRIYAHNAFSGANLGSGAPTADGIPLAYLGKAKSVIAGDIHIPQTVGGIVTYCGAPYRVDFGDDYEPRFLVIEQDTQKLRSVGCGGWPQKRLFEISKTAVLDKLETNEGDVVKLRIHVRNMKDWAAINAEASEWATKRQITLHLCEPIIKRVDADRSIVVAAPESDLSDDDILRQFAKRHSVDEETLDAGLELVK